MIFNRPFEIKCHNFKKMQSISRNPLLQFPSDAIQNIKKIHNLDKPGRLDEAINILAEWIQKQDHIIKKDIYSREYLEVTLITCKGSVEKSKKQIDRLATMKTLLPKFFSKVNVKEELKPILDLAWVVPLPKVTKDYYRVILVKMNNKRFSSEHYMQYYQMTLILTEYIMANDKNNGFILLFDYSELNILELMTKMNAVEIQQYCNIFLDGYGARLKAIHIVTESKAIELLITMMKQFISEKIGKRIHVHPTADNVHKLVPKEILPIEYGGHERSMKKLHDEWIDAISSEKHVEYMKMMNKACTDESRRRSSKFNEEYMGMPGSFRNLSVD